MERSKHTSAFLIFLLVLVGLVAGMYLIRGLLILLLLPFLFAYLMNPFVNLMERKGLSRGVGTLLIFLILSISLTFAILLLSKPAITQIQELKTKKELYKTEFNKWAVKTEEKLGISGLGLGSEETGDDTQQQLFEKAKNILPGIITNFIGSIVTFLAIVPLITFFLLRDGREIRKWIISLVPNKHFERAMVMQFEVSQQIGKYLRGELTRSVMVGSLITIGLWIIDGPYPILMGIFAGATNVIPFAGPYVGAVPTLIIVLFSGVGVEDVNIMMDLIAVAVVYGVAQTLDMILIQPLVLGKSVELHPLIIVIALLFGVEFLGILGMVLAVPVASVMKVIFVQLYKTQRKADLRVT